MYSSTKARWCPTPEQLMILEEMYRGGIRTPKAAQIQAITAHLSHYGKIEGKNVFYWFQNHKARDRQKLRRKLMMSKQQLQRNPGQNMPHHQLFYYVPVGILPQGASINASVLEAERTNYSVHVADKECKSEKTMSKTNGGDWVVMLDVGPINKPLKTLQLFPTSPTFGIYKSDQCGTSATTSSENPSSTSTH